jgi:acid phosphatase
MIRLGRYINQWLVTLDQEKPMMRSTASLVMLCSLFVFSFAQPTAPAYENLNAVLWMQTSVEYQASAVQTYRLAQLALLRGLRDERWTAALEQNGEFEKLPPAVVLDLDETVLDNSAFEARITASGETFSDPAWTKWVNERAAGLVPGAMDFVQFAHANGVTPVYITNRVCDSSKDDDPTVQQLRKLHLPLEAVSDQLLCAHTSKESDKTARREMIAKKYRILLLFGDQLGDFLQIPTDAADLTGRESLFITHQGLWGERWFQLPNPMYGSWEGAVGYSVDAKLSKLRK